VHHPPVLFLDEPTSALDARSRTELWSLIGQLVAEGTTVLLTTQYLEEADRLADRIVVIDHGRVIADGSAHDLKQRLGTTIVEVQMSTVREGRRAARRLVEIGAAEMSDGDRMVAVTTPDSATALVRIVRVLDAEDLTAASITVRTPTLEDVFLQITAPAYSGQGSTG
jgi:ABC-2 type transport system ATP-binding protein